MEQLKKMNVVWFRSEVLLQEMIDSTLEQERIIDRNVRDAINAVPTWLATARYRCIHHIV